MSSKPSLPPPAPSPARRFTDALERPGTVIGAGIAIKGEIQGGDSLELAGSLEGPARVEGFLVVRAGGRVVGPISARDVLVEGEVRGELITARKVEIGSAARVEANVRASVVAIAEGAYFQGQIEMSEGGGSMAFQEKRGRGEGSPAAGAPPPAAAGGQTK